MKVSRYTIIDKPRPAETAAYEKAIAKCVSKLSAESSVKSIYRAGGISAPGISDIDLVVVFRDDAGCGINIHDYLDEEEKYLIIHRLYGCPVKYLPLALGRTFFGNLTREWGENNALPEGMDETFKRQTAMEFLAKMFAVMSLQYEFRIIKLRAFLLEAYAIRFDLGFLGIKNSTLGKLVGEVERMRKGYFITTPGQTEIAFLFDSFYEALKELLSGFDAEYSQSPTAGSYHIGRNIRIRSGPFSYRVFGFIPRIPLAAGLFGRKYFNFLNRFSTADVSVPFMEAHGDILPERSRDISAMRKYNETHLPYFLPLVPPLKTD
jgi:hypothetical protein